jgi:hypothetical protein
MSALDFGAGSDTNTTRYYTLTQPELGTGNADWCALCWVWLNPTPTASDYYFPFDSSENLNNTTTDGIQMHWTNTSQFVGRCRGSADVLRDCWNVTMQASPGEAALCVLQRRGSWLEAYVIRKDDTVTAYGYRVAYSSGDVIASVTMRLGTSDTGGVNCWKDGLGEFAIFNDRSLSYAQITTLASGEQPNTANCGGEPYVHLPFRDGDANPEVNIGTGGATYNATRFGSGYTTTTEFFSTGPAPRIITPIASVRF